MRYLTVLSATFVCFLGVAQIAPTIEWQHALGGTDFEAASCLSTTGDGGYVFAGHSGSNNGDVTINLGSLDFWVVKLDIAGQIEWQRTMGGSASDYATDIQQTTDGGYIVIGTSASNDGDVTGAHGDFDVWVVKLSAAGTLEWQRTYGGSASDEGGGIVEVGTAGYLLSATVLSNDGDISGNHGGKDFWVARIDLQGNLLWQQCYGGSSFDEANGVVALANGFYLFYGYTYSNDGDVSGLQGSSDAWVIRIDSLGTLLWQRTIGGSDDDVLLGGLEVSSDTLVVIGYSYSDDGDISGSHGGRDSWVIWMDANGTVLDNRVYGGSDDESADDAIVVSNGDLVISSWSNSTDGDVTPGNGQYDAWLYRIEPTGNLVWQGSYGGSQADGSSSVIPTADGGYLFAGSTASNNGDVSGNHGGNDVWVVKLATDPTGILETHDRNRLEVYPNPVRDQLQVVLPTHTADVRVEVIDARGALCYSSTRSNYTGVERTLQVPTAALGSGTYMLRVFADGKVLNQPFVKQ